ncbi:MAG: NPCBM/NEW2 domain-containing protein [Planctomycetaceae bacterium]|jgi:hypothetical protein|nr:NPCBM/NEW2 domain-containing protein [Planctomycetaceae bacterium]
MNSQKNLTVLFISFLSSFLFSVFSVGAEPASLHRLEQEMVDWTLKTAKGKVGLDFNGERVTIDSPDKLPAKDFSRLDSLTLNEYKQLTLEDCKKIAQLPNLSSLQLSKINVSDEMFKEIAKQENLRFLSLSTEKPLDDFSPLAQLKKLRIIILEQQLMNNKNGSILANLPALSHITFRECQFQQGSIAPLTKNTLLSGLTLTKTELSDAEFKSIGQIKSLTTLNLDGTNLTDTEIQRLLPQLPKLLILSVNHTKVTRNIFQWVKDKNIKVTATHLPPAALKELTEIPASVKEIPLTEIAWDSAETGWGPPKIGSFETGSRRFDQCLFAHAVSSYVYKLDGTWNTLEAVYGISKDANGSVVFVVKGNGKELFRSEIIRRNEEKDLSVDISGVKNLELIVEDAQDGGNSDHGIWFEPKLKREIKQTDTEKTVTKKQKTTLPASQHSSEPDVPPIKVVYFIPADKKPISGTPERLGRVMKYVQSFYRKEMQRNGFGLKTFALEWETPEKLKLYVVKGQKDTLAYGPGGGADLYTEISPVLKEKYGINWNQEVILCFHQSMTDDVKEGEGTAHLPYAGGGNHLHGTCWVCDGKLQDAALLASKAPGGWYGGPCSIGQYNSHYIGGVAHELGHALGLPHGGETQWEKENLGTSLMGGGNHTFGQELRNEGRGTFLSKAAALQLSRIRAFAGNLPEAQAPATMSFEKLSAALETNRRTQKKEIVIAGTVNAVPPLVGISAYNIDSSMNEYICQTWTAPVNKNGTFRFVIDDLKPEPYVCRIRGIHQSGHCSEISLNYSLQGGKENLQDFNLFVPLEQLSEAFKKNDIEELNKIPAAYPKMRGILQNIADFLCGLLKPEELIKVADLPGNIKTADLSNAEFAEVKVGWAKMMRRQVPDTVVIKLSGQLFNSGIFAHAESHIKVDLSGKWQEFDFGYGIQDGCPSVPLYFSVLGDGTVLFRSEVIEDHKEYRKTVSVKGVKELELRIKPVGDSNRSASSVWTKPILKR